LDATPGRPRLTTLVVWILFWISFAAMGSLFLLIDSWSHHRPSAPTGDYVEYVKTARNIVYVTHREMVLQRALQWIAFLSFVACVGVYWDARDVERRKSRLNSPPGS
jgi:hypothetical protein